jgi:hypothetical protein
MTPQLRRVSYFSIPRLDRLLAYPAFTLTSRCNSGIGGGLAILAKADDGLELRKTCGHVSAGSKTAAKQNARFLSIMCNDVGE